MEKRVSESPKVFDGDKFPVWKYHMEICFDDEEIMPIANGTIPKPPENATEAEKNAWQKANALAMYMISSSVSFPVLENLVNCPTAACMWNTLCSIYQQKSRENIHMAQNAFFEYKMNKGDSINTHVNKLISMGNFLKDLGQPVGEELLLTKIICSLPPSYNTCVAAWANVPVQEQTVASLKIRLLQMENILAFQGGEAVGDSALFTRSSKVTSKHKKQGHEKSTEYIKDLKSRTRCYSCGEFDHWTAECPHPRQEKIKFPNQKHNRPDRKSKHTKGKRSEACLATTTDHTNSSTSGSSSDSDDSCAFTTINNKSHALIVNFDKQAWFAHSSATEHMTEHREWFSTFEPIAPGTWSVKVADDRQLWVRGVGNIEIIRTIDGKQRNGLLHKVLYIPELRRNLFSIGLTSKAGLSFQTFGEQCALYRNFGKGPKVMEGRQIGNLYKLNIKPVIPVSGSPGIFSGHQTSSVLATTSSGLNELDL